MQNIDFFLNLLVIFNNKHPSIWISKLLFIILRIWYFGYATDINKKMQLIDLKAKVNGNVSKMMNHTEEIEIDTFSGQTVVR